MPDNSYTLHEKHYVAVDCVIFGYEREELKVLLYRRGFEPSAGKWSLLGGFVGTNETLGDAARRVLYNTTGLQNIYQEQVHAFSKPDRDPAGRVISVAYYALIRINQQDSDLVSDHGAQLVADLKTSQTHFRSPGNDRKLIAQFAEKGRHRTGGQGIAG